MCERLDSLLPFELLRRNHHHHISSSSSLGSDVRHPNRITNRFYHRMLHNLYGAERFSFNVNTIRIYMFSLQATHNPIPSQHTHAHVFQNFVWILHSVAFVASIGIIQINILFLSVHKFLIFFFSRRQCRGAALYRLQAEWKLCL